MAWDRKKIGEFVIPLERWESVVPTKRYGLLGMRSNIGGPFLREVKSGDEISAATLNRVQTGDFIYSRLFAWQGSFGLVPETLSGCHVSNEFPIFSIDCSKADPRFLNYWFGLHSTRIRVERDCYGSTPGTRNRFKEEYFYELEVPLPTVEVQREIAQRLDDVQAKLKERKTTLEAIERDTSAMLFNFFQRVINGAEWRLLGDVAPLVRRPIDVKLEGKYHELGVRSFGKGTFHKPSLTGADVGNKRLFEIHEGDLVFNIVFAWEGAIAVSERGDHGRVGSHRFLTCVPKQEVAIAEFLRYYLLTPEGMQKVGEASPGGAGRNRTLGIKTAESIRVPVPAIDAQRSFCKLCDYVERIRSIRAAADKDLSALIPVMLQEVFGEQSALPHVRLLDSGNNVVSIPKPQTIAVDTPFKEAVLVGAIVRAFHAGGGQPLGNFRLQKAVYFARRHMGECALDTEYLRKAAGPYNPSMRYSGGIKIATDKKWIARAKGKFGEGSALGSAAAEMDAWIAKYRFEPAAVWVRDRFKFKSNDIWETLATVDYAMLALDHAGTPPNAAAILAYVENDPEWCPKIARLRLSKASVQNAIVELQSLFVGGALTRAT